MSRKCFWLTASLVLSFFCVWAPAATPAADLNGDGNIDLADMAILSSQWLQEAQPGLELVWADIPGGTFQMGDAFKEGNSDERPVHPVTLDPFKISRYEVTNAQYVAFLNYQWRQNRIKVVNGVVYAAADDTNSQPWIQTYAAQSLSCIDYVLQGNNQIEFMVSNKDNPPRANHPVTWVTWYGAQAFCQTLDCRLPTEAEWEYAARGGLVGKRFPWGDTISHDNANYRILSQFTYDDQGYNARFSNTRSPYTAPVGQFPANDFGLYDVTGNALEWTGDWYDEKYYQQSSVNNPEGPTTGQSKVLRGAGWNSNASVCRLACRAKYSPATFNGSFSFRPTKTSVQKILISDFNDGTLDGWTIANFDGGKLYIRTSQHPEISGFILAEDVERGGSALELAGPASLSGDLSQYSGIQWSEYIVDQGVSNRYAPAIIIDGNNGTSYWFRRNFDKTDVWTTAYISFDLSQGWNYYAGIVGNSFEDVIHDVKQVRILMDVSTSLGLECAIDNVYLIKYLNDYKN